MNEERTIKQLWDELQGLESKKMRECPECHWHGGYHRENCNLGGNDNADEWPLTLLPKDAERLNALRIELLPRIHKDCDIMFCRGGSMVFHQGCNIMLTADQAEEYAAAFQVAAWEVRRRASEPEKGGDQT